MYEIAWYFSRLTSEKFIQKTHILCYKHFLEGKDDGYYYVTYESLPILLMLLQQKKEVKKRTNVINEQSLSLVVATPGRPSN
jgi:hypothetical protein